jgi:hypothetical protein
MTPELAALIDWLSYHWLLLLAGIALIGIADWWLSRHPALTDRIVRAVFG